jgi:hypothetical protein
MMYRHNRVVSITVTFIIINFSFFFVERATYKDTVQFPQNQNNKNYSSYLSHKLTDYKIQHLQNNKIIKAD